MSNPRVWARFAAAVSLGLGLFAGGLPALGGEPGSAEAAGPVRIVSLAPSITESLFEMGLGGRVVGVTNYCVHPDEAKSLPKVGGYVTPSFETIAALRPSLLFLLPEHEESRRNLRALGARVVDIDNRNVDVLLESFRTMGAAAGAAGRGETLAGELRERLERVGRTVAGRPRPKTLLCVSVSAGPSGIKEVRGGAPGSFHADLLKLAGADNATPSGLAYYPLISSEGLLRMDPDVIVSFEPGSSSVEDVLKEWKQNKSLRAVRNGRVYVFAHEFLTIPGPRLLRFVEDLALVLHPDAPWEAALLKKNE